MRSATKLARKLIGLRWWESSICQMFLSRWVMAHLRERSVSERPRKRLRIHLHSLVIRWSTCVTSGCWAWVLGEIAFSREQDLQAYIRNVSEKAFFIQWMTRRFSLNRLNGVWSPRSVNFREQRIAPEVLIEKARGLGRCSTMWFSPRAFCSLVLTLQARVDDFLVRKPKSSYRLYCSSYRLYCRVTDFIVVGVEQQYSWELATAILCSKFEKLTICRKNKVGNSRRFFLVFHHSNVQ